MTTPAVITEAHTAAEVIGQLDEDWAVACERAYAPKCDGANAAVWVVYFVPCCPDKPVFRLWCDPCLRVVLDNPIGCICPRCGTRAYKPSDAFRLIEPLTRRTT